RRMGAELVRTVKGWPRNVQLAAAGGLAVVLLITMIVVFTGGDETPPAPQAQPSATAPAGPGVEMQEHAARGIQVMVPKGWKKATGGVYIDYVDPEDSGRKVRVLTEKFGGDSSLRWAEIAANGLKKAKSCPKPYSQLEMAEKELAGKPAAEFEYTCGEGETMRHGVWRGVVSDGKVYSFYLTSNNDRFAESKPIFDEMVQTFKLTDAS
ncbi:PsbP-related protein, partial [Micromonospora azadirachtae]